MMIREATMGCSNSKPVAPGGFPVEAPAVTDTMTLPQTVAALAAQRIYVWHTTCEGAEVMIFIGSEARRKATALFNSMYGPA